MLGEIADLLEIRADNPFKIRAYRNAAETVVAEPSRVADMPDAALRELPGIGKDLAQRIREIADTGDTPYRQELLAAFPPTLLDLLRLQGVGPKTVKRLYDELGVASLDTLEAACKDGRVSALKGMGDKKQALILKAIEERKRYAGRHLAAQVEKAARVVVSHLKASYPDADFTPVGSLRRGVETCGDLDILAVGAPPAVMDAFTSLPEVTRVLGRGETKSSVLLGTGLQADLRLVVSELEQGRPAASTVVLETIAADLRERYGCAMTFDLKVPPSDFEPGIWSAMIETSGGLAQMLADIFAARRLHIGLLADSKPILHVSHDGQSVADNAELLAAARALVGRGGASLKIDSQSGAERLTLDWTS